MFRALNNPHWLVTVSVITIHYTSLHLDKWVGTLMSLAPAIKAVDLVETDQGYTLHAEVDADGPFCALDAARYALRGSTKFLVEPGWDEIEVKPIKDPSASSEIDPSVDLHRDSA